MSKEIREVDLINFKKVSEFLTGKSFNLRSDRYYGKHKEVVDDLLLSVREWMDDILEERGEIEMPEWKKKMNEGNPVGDNKVLGVQIPSNGSVKFVPNDGSASKNTISVVVEKKPVDMDALRDIAAGKGLKGYFSLTKKKIPIDELYEFEVGSLPDVDDRVFLDNKNITMVDKYNPGVFFAIWENRNLKFDKKEEFNRFCKDQNISLK